MKEIRIKTNENTAKEHVTEIPTLKLASDWFKCRKCGYTVRKLVLGNLATCSECGGTMDRI